MFSLTVFSSLIARHWPLWPLMSCIRRDLSETSQCWSFTRRERAGKMRSPCPFTMRKARLVCPSLSWFHTSYFLHGTDWGEVSNGLPSEAQGKNKPLQTQRFHLLQNTCFLFQNPFYKIAKNSSAEPIRKQKFFNQNPMEIPLEPIRRERICQNFFKALREGPDF